MPAQSLTDSGSVKIFVYAASGWGKTRLAGTSPGRGLFIRPPVDYVDSILPADKPRHEQWVVKDWSDMEDVFEALRHEGREKYDWVWFDSISAYQDIGLDDLWEQIIIEKPARKRYGLDKGDYWINMQRLGRWVRDVATLSDSGAFNFGITAWPAEISPNPEDPEAVDKQMPWVQGKNMAMKMCGYVNIVAFGDITSKGTRVLQTKETDRCYAKDQFDSEPNGRILNPTMPKILAKIDRARGTTQGRSKKAARTTRRRGARRK